MKTKDAGFTVTDHKGFRIRFTNGYSVSVQWGPGNYISRPKSERALMKALDFEAPRKSDYWGSVDAEIAIFRPDGKWHRLEGMDDDVKGYVTPDELVNIFKEVASL